MKNRKLKLPASMRRFIKEQRISCKESSVRCYMSALKDFIGFLLSDSRANIIRSKQIASLQRQTLDRYLVYLHRQKLKPYSRVNKFLAVKKYLVWETERGALNPAALDGFDRSKLPKVPEYLPRPLSRETDRLLMDKLRTSNDPCAKAFLLLRLTGLRISELVNIPNNCVMTTAKNEPFLKVPLGKMNNERLVPLNDETLAIIAGLKSSRGLDLGPHDRNRLLGIRGAIPSVYWRLSKKFKTFTANISDQNKSITFHRLRHTYATSLLSGGAGIVSLMKLLGHRRIKMTLRYAQVTPTHLRNEYLKALAVIERQFIPAKEQNLNPIIARVAPAEIIDQLASFIKKDLTLPASDQKNLARRLSRLGSFIKHLHIPDHFPILPTAKT